MKISFSQIIKELYVIRMTLNSIPMTQITTFKYIFDIISITIENIFEILNKNGLNPEPVYSFINNDLKRFDLFMHNFYQLEDKNYFMIDYESIEFDHIMSQIFELLDDRINNKSTLNYYNNKRLKFFCNLSNLIPFYFYYMFIYNIYQQVVKKHCEAIEPLFSNITHFKKIIVEKLKINFILTTEKHKNIEHSCIYYI